MESLVCTTSAVRRGDLAESLVDGGWSTRSCWDAVELDLDRAPDPFDGDRRFSGLVYVSRRNSGAAARLMGPKLMCGSMRLGKPPTPTEYAKVEDMRSACSLRYCSSSCSCCIWRDVRDTWNEASRLIVQVHVPVVPGRIDQVSPSGDFLTQTATRNGQRNAAVGQLRSRSRHPRCSND